MSIQDYFTFFKFHLNPLLSNLLICYPNCYKMRSLFIMMFTLDSLNSIIFVSIQSIHDHTWLVTTHHMSLFVWVSIVLCLSGPCYRSNVSILAGCPSMHSEVMMDLYNDIKGYVKNIYNWDIHVYIVCLSACLSVYLPGLPACV